MRKEAEEAESPKRSIRDSGYIDCWDSERSDSLSPPRHGREDSFDSLDSFGSRSRQTPSPDVLVARGSSDGRGSDSESDGPPHRKLPDVRKDDMSARRTSVSEPRTAMPFNQYLPNKSNQSGYVPTPLRKKKSDKDEGGRKSWGTATSPIGGDRPLSTPARSCSEELFRHPAGVAANAAAAAAAVAVVASGMHPPVTEQREEAAPIGAAAEREEKRGRRAATSPEPCPSHALPVPVAAATATADTGRRKGRARSESEEPHGGGGGPSWLDNSLPATFTRTRSVSDDPQSVSMIDMRGEEDAMLHPHSQVRHELMHNQYNKMKEEEDHWQDDLARWKNRRRSISQDLIKKEEERKMMEQLMTGDAGPSARRRSVKTYREIVEDKERREEELRAAYKRARTPEEASHILQRYAQRFSISDAVLERLQLPKLLDRSVSADPSFPCSPFPLSLSLSASPTTPDPFDADPGGPLRYLRQQSAPPPKFTSTLEARVEEFPHRPQIRSRSSEPPSSRGLAPKPLPLLAPKPHLQTRPTPTEPWPSKADAFLRVNGDVGSADAPATAESHGRESPPQFQASPSPSSPTRSPARQEPTPRDKVAEPPPTPPPSRPTSLPSELQKPEESFGKTGSQLEAAPEEKPRAAAAQQKQPAEAKQEKSEKETSSSFVHQTPAATQQATPPTLQEKENAPGTFGFHPPTETAEFANSIRSPLATSNPKLRWDFFAPPEEMEKECRGNEKYRREQEKLKEEWEKAQREVAEEERKYHEEERRILEETVAPLTPRSSALPSPSRGELSSASEPHDTIVRSLADWERKQELLERQSKGNTESVEWKQRKNDRTSDISTADDSMKTGRSLVSQSSSQAETLAHSLQNGQKAKASTPTKKQEAAGDGGKPGRPAGDRRILPIDNNMSRSSSKPPAACPPPADTPPPAPNRSVSGKKLCSSCGQPLGKGAAMIIETLSLYFHIQCFKCGVCKGQLGDTTTGTDVRIRNGLLNCHQCYIRSRSAGQPTTL